MQKETQNGPLEKRIEHLFEHAFKFAQRLHRSDLTSDIRQLWQALTVDRSNSLATYFKNPALRRAYIGYYMPLYAAKMALLLERSVREGVLSKKTDFKVLDLGSGPLVGVLASYLAFGTLAEARAVDREIGPMRYGRDFLETFLDKNEIARIRLIKANLEIASAWRSDEAPDLIILSHVLNELGSSRRFLPNKLKLVLSAASTLAQGGRMLIVEPATRVSTRELMALRDALYLEKSVTIWAPCTGAEKCPLLQTSSGWCHGELAWRRPEVCSRIDEKIGFDKSLLKYSYLLIGKKESKESAISAKQWRVISGPMRHEGILRRYVCTSSGALTLSEHEKQAKKPYLAGLFRGELIDKSQLESGIQITRE